MPNRPTHFEIHATDPETLIPFYSEIFGWEFKKWEGGQFEYWMITTGERTSPGGIDGGLIRRNCAKAVGNVSPNAFVCTIVIDTNYDEFAKSIIIAGGVEAMPKMALKGMAWQGYFLDPDGNLFGLHQPDANAA